MYWFRSGNPVAVLPWLAVFGAACLGGWLIASHIFHLERRERLAAGLGLGLLLDLWLSNVLGHWLGPTLAFSLAGLLTLAAGLALAWPVCRRTARPLLDLRDVQWPILLALVLLAVFFTALGKGLGIFDEPKNLTIISRMAAGDLPPHYYLNADYYFRYHYGFQLLSATLMRLGGLFPWSAFDLAKGLVFALAVVLVGLAGQYTADQSCADQKPAPRIPAGVLAAGVFTLANGARYLLLFVPPAWLAGLDSSILLLGTSANMAVPFSQSLARGWTIDGGPPIPYVFGFLNGISPTLTMAHAGSPLLSAAILALLMLLAPRLAPGRLARRAGVVVLAVVLAYWAMVWESSYALFALGGAAAWLCMLWQGPRRAVAAVRTALAHPGFQALLLSAPLALGQGGTFTEIVRQLLFASADSGIGVEGEVAAAGFHLRWPPAVLSSHLGALNIFSPGELLVAGLEIGPVILFTPWITLWAWKRLRGGDWLAGSLAFAAWIGFLAPLFLVYQAERDISRLTGFSVQIWTLYLVIMLAAHAPELQGKVLRQAAVLSLVVVVFSGLVTTATSLSAISSPSMLAYKMTGMDARIGRDFWDRLPGSGGVDQDNLVFDSFGWRASALTGLPTRAAIGQDVLPVWGNLQQQPTVEALLEAGYCYVYVDENWWNDIPESSRESLSTGCVSLLGEYYDAEHVTFRRLLDLTGCRP